MLHRCDDGRRLHGEAVKEHLRGTEVVACFQLTEGGPLKIEIYNPNAGEDYDTLYEEVGKCPFCGFTPETAKP